MDENSREEETSVSAENLTSTQRPKKSKDRMPELENLGIIIKPNSGHQEIQVTERIEPSLNDSGTSSMPLLPSLQKQSDEEEILLGSEDEDEDNDDDDDDEHNAPVLCRTAINKDIPREVDQQHDRSPPMVEQSLSPRKPIIGPPPSYSFVMNQKAKTFKPRRSLTPVNNRLPPPTYSGMQRLYLPPDEAQRDRFYGLPSFSEPMWRSHSQPALCPRCGIIILTTTYSHESVATHVAAVVLCLFGCWPCCLLPYCINACKNTYHHCPICQTFLGSYSPW